MTDKQPIRLDEDWIRRNSWGLPTDLAGLLRLSRASTVEKEAEWLARLLQQPAAEAMPDGLRREALQYLIDHRKKP